MTTESRPFEGVDSVAAINHPNIVRISDFQADGGEPAFLVMELLEGASLGRVIEVDGPFTQRRAAFVGSQVLAALARLAASSTRP